MSVVTVVPTVEPSTGVDDPPRIRLNVTDVGTSPAITSTTVTRLDPDGRTVPVRTFDGNPLVLSTSGADRVGLLYDYEAPFAPVSYSTMESPTVVSAEVTLSESQVWLIHPGVPALSRPVELRADSLADEVYPVQQGVFSPMGRENPVIVTDGTRKGMQSSLTVDVDTADELRALKALIADAGTLFFNPPASMGLLVDPCYIAVGDVQIARVTNIGKDPYRSVRLPFVVTDRPIGGSQSERTYVDLLGFGTYTALQTAYPTYTALLAGP